MVVRTLREAVSSVKNHAWYSCIVLCVCCTRATRSIYLKGGHGSPKVDKVSHWI